MLAAGEDAISAPAARRLQFNEAMIRFYDSLDDTGMMAFMAGRSLDRTLRAAATPGQSHRA